ncbi:MAG TPA: serine/threonine-protein kinase [Gemmatimonadales bacterium]|jgi:serine/threonine-protein kinase
MTVPVDPLFVAFQQALAGRYSLERELGRGGMGIVYLAREVRLDRRVAIKLLPPVLAAQPAPRERFLGEARTAAQLSHPNIIPIYTVDEVGDFVYFVMAYIEGETLAQRVRQSGPLTSDVAARMLREVAWALAYAHAQGVIHRDVKAENILLEGATGRAVVADFGIARRVQAAVRTGEGELVGTPEYMSPEQASGEPVDGRSDLYALGVVGYFAMSGRLPFTGDSVSAVIMQQLTRPPPPLVTASAPGSLVAAVERCLVKDPGGRFQKGEDFADAAGAALDERRGLPIPIRAFLSEGRSRTQDRIMGSLIGSAFLVPWILEGMIRAVFGGRAPAGFLVGTLGVGVVLGVAGLVSPLVLQLRRVRRLLTAGYDHDDLTRGLLLELDRRSEEQEFLRSRGAAAPQRGLPKLAYGALVVAAVSAAASFIVPYPAILGVFGLFGLSCATAIAAGWFSSAVASRHGLVGEQERRLAFWKGRIGRWLFRLARIGAKPLPAIAGGDRPTELALGHVALALFEALPSSERDALPDLPRVVRSLEEKAQRMRRRLEQPGPAPESAAQRAATQQRLAETVAALETIRLGLLRLRAGAGTVGGLTADLAAALQIGEATDRLLQAGKEVSALLEKGSPVP